MHRLESRSGNCRSKREGRVRARTAQYQSYICLQGPLLAYLRHQTQPVETCVLVWYSRVVIVWLWQLTPCNQREDLPVVVLGAHVRAQNEKEQTDSKSERRWMGCREKEGRTLKRSTLLSSLLPTYLHTPKLSFLCSRPHSPERAMTNGICKLYSRNSLCSDFPPHQIPCNPVPKGVAHLSGPLPQIPSYPSSWKSALQQPSFRRFRAS